MRLTCDLIFATSLGGQRVIRIPDPRANLAMMHVNIAAGQIMPANLFDETVGQLTELIRAEQVLIKRDVLIEPRPPQTLP